MPSLAAMTAMKKVRDRLGELARPTGEEDLMRVDCPEPRLQITVRQAVVVAALLAAATCVVIIVRLLAASSDEPAAGGAAQSALGESAVTVAPLEAGGAAAPSSQPPEPAAGEVVVSVVGHVARPGLVRLPAGSRVADALGKAEVLEGSDPRAVNLARRLSDGEQIVVPAPGEELPVPAPSGDTSAVAGEAAPGKVSLNTAGAAELMTLTGVGEVTAQAIIEYRESNGGFTDVDQLNEVRGIGPAKFAALQDAVSL